MLARPLNIDIVLPVHNEAQSIEATLREFDSVVRGEAGTDVRFVVCEDGSSDGSAEVLRRLSDEVPIKLLSSSARKGYSRAVVDGFRAVESEIVGFIDSDGQCDPHDFRRLLSEIDNFDFVIGYRHPRNDHWIRLAMSRAFGLVYRALFPIALRDPSCPYFLMKKSALETVLSGNVGILKQGFWWEFNARILAHGLKIKEVPVTHRQRASGVTQVYRPSKVPKIAWQHLRGLFALKRELATLRKPT
jgi:dolichol-phosphate mannosyltransferase